MKKVVTKSRKETWDLDPASHTATPPAENAGRGSEIDQSLAQLVWKHFGEEITEILREVQEELATEEEDSTST